MANKMEVLAKKKPRYLGIDNVRNEVGLTVSYWGNLDAIKNWKQQTKHLQAQQKGRQYWYSLYNVRICKVEHEYEFYS